MRWRPFPLVRMGLSTTFAFSPETVSSGSRASAESRGEQERCSGGLPYHVAIWLLLDLQGRVFAHRRYHALAVCWRPRVIRCRRLTSMARSIHHVSVTSAVTSAIDSTAEAIFRSQRGRMRSSGAPPNR